MGFAMNSTRLFSANPTAASSMDLSSPWLDKGVYKYFHQGKFVSSSATSFHEVYNPATNELVGKVPDTTDTEFEEVMKTAQAAFEDWKKVPVHQRQRVMLEYQRLLRENLTDLAGLITLENGKTLADAKGDVIRGLEVVETACQVAPHLLGDSLAGISSNMDCTSYREPLGVCAGVGTFKCIILCISWERVGGS
jgi:malonate-semialdehyde dehydrogenase (acetylating)/methylmalonate-semialdehyde dehydrogenase